MYAAMSLSIRDAVLEAPLTSHRGVSPVPARRAAVRAVVVHFRCLPQTLALLERLRADLPGLPVIVVANGSGDGSDEELSAIHAGDPHRQVLVAATNRGFGAGCNLGIEAALAAADCRQVLLLNPDLLPEPGFLDALLDTASRHPEAAVVGARIVSMDGSRVLFENGRIRPITLSRCQVPAPRGPDEFRTGFVSGACMLIDARILREGLRFDERYFLYVEDLDLCREVLARGRELWVTSRAVVRHEDGGTQREDAALPGGMRRTQLHHLARGKVLFARKWSGPLGFALSCAFAACVKPLAALCLWRSWAPVRAHLGGLADGLRAARKVRREGRR
jgi:GT2 family glycosyltransferase